MQVADELQAESLLQTLYFPEGLPGFETYREFSLILTEMTGLYWLQSTVNDELYFLTINPWLVDRNYSLTIDEDSIEKLGITSEQDVMVLAIVTIPEDYRKMTANLKAPVIIHVKSGHCKQLVLDGRYELKTPVFPNQESIK